jgi:hypothetical protein
MRSSDLASHAPLRAAANAGAWTAERMDFTAGASVESSWSHAFPGRRRPNGALRSDLTFEGGQLATCATFRPATSSPHALVHAPWLLGTPDPAAPDRLQGITTAVRVLGDGTAGPRAVGRVLAWGDCAPPSAIRAAITADPLLPPDPAAPTLALDVPREGPRAADWPDRDEAVATLLSGVPLVAQLSLEGGVLWPDLETFTQLADTLWEGLPPALRPLFSWGWNVRTGSDHGRPHPLPGALCFTASDVVPPDAARVRMLPNGALRLAPPATPGTRGPLPAATAWTMRLAAADPDAVATVTGFGEVSLLGSDIGPWRTAHPDAAHYRVLLQAGTPKARQGERRIDLTDSGLPSVLRGVARAVARLDLRAGLRRWIDDGVHPDAPESPDPPTVWTGEPQDVDAVQAEIRDGWTRWTALGRPPAMGGRLILLQHRLGLRAKDSRSVDFRLAHDRVIEADAAVPLAGALGSALHALDAAGPDPRFPAAREALARWCAVDPEVRALAACQDEVAPVLGAALAQACEVVAWPWTVPHDELGSRDRCAVAAEVARMLAPMMSGATADPLLAQVASLQLVALGTETRVPGAVSGPSLARIARVAERLPPVDRIHRLSLQDRRGLARVLVATLCGDADLASLPWPTGEAHAWAWSALRALDEDGVLTDLAHADWFHMHLRDAPPGPALLRSAAASVPAALAARGMFPPRRTPRLPDLPAPDDDEDRPTVVAGVTDPDTPCPFDRRTAHALLYAWPQVARLAEAGAAAGRHATAVTGRSLLARYLPHWPPGLPELLAPASGLQGQGPAPGTEEDAPDAPILPAVTGAELNALTRRDDLAICGEAPWWFALRLHATGSPGDIATTMIALASGTIPQAAPDDRAFEVAMRCIRALPVGHPRVRHLLARCEESTVPPAASYAVVAMMTAEQVGEPTGRLLERLRRWYVTDEHQRRRIPTIQQCFDKTHPAIEALLTATFLSLDPAQWRPAYAGTMIALCFQGVRTDALPARHPDLWREYFKGGDLFEMAVRFAQAHPRAGEHLHAVAELLAPRCEAAHLSGREAAMVRARGYARGTHGPGRAPEDLFWWTARRWETLRRGGVVRYGSWVDLHATEVQAATLLASGVGVVLLAVAGHVPAACGLAAAGFATTLWLRRTAVAETYRVLRARGRSTASGTALGDILMTDDATRFMDLYAPIVRAAPPRAARR